MPPVVLHVSETTAGGVGTVLADLLAAEAEQGWRVVVAAPHDDHLTPLVISRGGSWIDWSPGSKPDPRLPLHLRRLARVVAQHRPDLVHLHTSMAGMCGRLVVRRRQPTLFQPHSWSFFAVTGAARRGALAWERAAARWSDVVLCVSEDERRHAERAGVEGTFVVIPNGVDLARFRPVEDAERSRLRERLGVADGPVAVCVGRLHRQKGQHLLLDAWPAVLDVVPGARLVLVGDGPDRGDLEARTPPRTTFTGHTAHVRDWLVAADVVVQPSMWEGMSLSLLEAMAASRSVVVTDVPGMREVVRPGCGAVVPPADPAALADAVARRLIEPALATEEGSASRRIVEQEHDVAHQRRRVLDLSERLMEERGCRG